MRHEKEIWALLAPFVRNEKEIVLTRLAEWPTCESGDKGARGWFDDHLLTRL